MSDMESEVKHKFKKQSLCDMRYAICVKRVTILCGHYGSGKTNIAVNIALALKNKYQKVALADMDIVNPYYRHKAASETLMKAGVRLIASEFANSTVDFPALPSELYSVIDDKETRFVLDIGGDDRGALALGRLTSALKDGNDYEMLFVVNKHRPLTQTPQDAFAIMREIETACGLAFTGIANNPNIGVETTEKTIADGAEYAKEVSRLAGLPIKFTAAKENLADRLDGKIANLLPLKIFN